MNPKEKPLKSEILAARCEPQLREEVVLVAKFQRRDPSDIVRLAVEEYVSRCRQGAPSTAGAFPRFQA